MNLDNQDNNNEAKSKNHTNNLNIKIEDIENKIGKKIPDKLCVYEANRKKIMNNEYTFTIKNNRSQTIRQFKKKIGRQRAGKVVY